MNADPAPSTSAHDPQDPVKLRSMKVAAFHHIPRQDDPYLSLLADMISDTASHSFRIS